MKAIILLIILFLFSACSGKVKNISFKNDVQPILYDNCSDCHYGSDIQGNIKFDSYESVINSKYFDKPDPMIVPGNPERSRIYYVINSNRDAIRMPPADQGYDKLEEDEINTIKVWIEEGAKNN